jgi:20S proteasome subunit alpha 2
MHWQQCPKGQQAWELKVCCLVLLSTGTHLRAIASNGIVIATEKKSSSILIDDSMLDKVAVVCPNIGIVYSGMGPDFRVLIAKARKSAQAYWKIYGEYPPTRVLTQEVATVMQQATQSGYVVHNMYTISFVLYS